MTTHTDLLIEGLTERRRALRRLAEDVAIEQSYGGERDYEPVCDLVVPTLAAAVVMRPVEAFRQLVAATGAFSDFCGTPGPLDRSDERDDEAEYQRLEERQLFWLDVLTGRVPEPQVAR